MQSYEDNFKIAEGNDKLEASFITVLGDRSAQEDNFGYEIRDEESLFVVCDGMGGHKGGKIASRLAVETFLTEFANKGDKSEIDFLIDTAHLANDRITGLTDEDGQLLRGGSTCVAILIKDNKLYWNSVGDSRAYIFRNGEYVQLTTDQNYMAVLKEIRTAGIIDDEKFAIESKKAEALISYLGVGVLGLIDYNNEPFELVKNDKIIIMSDGLYKLLPDETIFKIVDNFSNISEALESLETRVQREARHGKKRDNMTVALIKIK